MRATTWSAAVVLLTLTVAGCVSPPETSQDDDGAVGSPILQDALAALKQGATNANIHRLANLDVGRGQELDAWGDYLAVMQSPKVLIVNVSNPEEPELVSEVQLSAVKDVKWSDDGAYIFVGDDAQGALPEAPEDNSNGGFYVIDARDKSNPEVKSYLPIGPERGPHMVAYERMPDGTEVVTGANGDVSITTFDRTTETLTHVATYRVNPLLGPDRGPERIDVLYGVPGWAHDMFLDTEADGTVLMYVANWDAGLRVVDITDPTNPMEIGAWRDYPEGHAGNLHTVSTEWIGDRRITVGSPEIGFAVVGGTLYAMKQEATGVYVWDTTDLQAIQLLGFWQHPEDECAYEGFSPPSEDVVTSTHNLQLEQGRVYLAHYACGAYVLDVSTPELQKDPRLLAFDRGGGLASMWDVVLLDGLMYYGDSAGVFPAHFALDVRGPEGVTSRA